MQKIALQRLNSFCRHGIETDILRLDRLHPIISGNKWFKLKYYLQEALASGSSTIASFGGAYSNHIVATAYAANAEGLKSIGYIRGEATTPRSHTLEQAEKFGMELRFISREQYKDKPALKNALKAEDGIYWINEGGYGKPGADGAAEILEMVPANGFTHILCAAGTGTMMAGLINGSSAGQEVVGISVLKNHGGLEREVSTLLSPNGHKPFSILHEYHFGGYAKHPPELINHMNALWETESLPTDIVYTSKLLFAAQDLVSKKHFPAGSRLLLIHSGGLQGNESLPSGTLSF